MKIPRIDPRGREDIIKKIKVLSRSFTPEWDFEAENPDIAAAAALIYVDMAKTSIDKFNLTCEKNMIEFFSRLGAEPLSSAPAEGFVTFVTAGSEQNVAGEYIEKGRRVAADSGGVPAVFATEQPLYAVNTTLRKVLYTDGERDTVCCLYENEEKRDFYEISLDLKSFENLQRHRIFFPCELLDLINSETTVMVNFGFDGADAELQARFIKAVCRSGISYFTAEGERKCRSLRESPQGVEFSLDTPPVKTRLFERECCWLKIEFESIAGIEDVYLKSISCKTKNKQLLPESIFNENGQLTTSRFEPYEFGLMLYSSVYFSDRLVFSRKGARITLQFSLRYRRVPIVESADDSIEWKYIMKKSSLKKPVEYDISIRQVVWEYFNGSGWVRLFKDNSYEDVFNGKNDNSTVKISFECPFDISSVFLPSGEGYAIRARIAGVENYMKNYGYYIMPQVFMKGISYEYEQWAECRFAAAQNNLESEIFDFNGLAFRFIKGLENRQRTIEFCFSSPLAAADIRLLISPDRRTETQKGEGDCLWEYLTADGYRVLSAVDGSSGMSKTGLLSLERNGGAADKSVMGESFYRIRARFIKSESFPACKKLTLIPNTVMAKNAVSSGDEYFYVSKEDSLSCRLSRSGLYELKVMVNELSAFSQVRAEEMIAQGLAEGEYGEDGSLTRLWIRWQEYDPVKNQDKRFFVADRELSQVSFGVNGGAIPPPSDDANVRISYLTCQGRAANLPPLTPMSFLTGGGLISSIFTPLGFTGGCDREGLKKTVERSGASLRMCGRLRTAADYESYIAAEWRDILRVRCFCSRDKNGASLSGGVAIVILLRDMNSFDTRREQLLSRLKSISPHNMRGMHPAVIRPTYVLYSIKAELVCDRFDSAVHIKQRAMGLVREYLDIENGGSSHRGWQIGELPEKMTLYTLLASIPEVTAVNEFSFLEANDEGIYLTDRELEELIEKGMCVPLLESIEIDVKIDV